VNYKVNRGTNSIVFSLPKGSPSPPPPPPPKPKNIHPPQTSIQTPTAADPAFCWEMEKDCQTW